MGEDLWELMDSLVDMDMPIWSSGGRSGYALSGGEPSACRKMPITDINEVGKGLEIHGKEETLQD